MSKVFHRQLNKPLVADLGRGPYIQTTGVEGSDNLCDLSSGAGVTCLGYSSDNNVQRAMVHQICRLPYVHAANWTTDATEALAEKLISITQSNPVAGTHAPNDRFNNGAVMFLNGGAEAIEAACKLGIQYWKELGYRHPSAFFARHHSYHGNTLFTLNLGDHPRKYSYSELLDDHYFLRFKAYKPTWDRPTDLIHYRHQCLEGLSRTLQFRCEQKMPSIVVIEPVGGTTLGIEPPNAEYLAGVREICKTYGALLIYDEVLCGNYRTGELFAWQRYQRYTDRPLDPDMIVIGKGLTGGYFPLSAVIVCSDVVDVVRQGSHTLWHSTTNQNHPLGCAAGLAALDMYCQDGTKHLMSWLGNELGITVRHYLSNLSSISMLSGVGSLRAIRLRSDAAGLHKRVRERALQKGVAVYTEGGTVYGKGNFILLAPPYMISEADLFDGIDKLVSAIKEVCDDQATG